jgi:hypothetical protein
VTRSVTHLTGAERPTAVQFRGMSVFERSDDHVKAGAKAESHAEREDSACLNQSLSFGPARRNDTRGRIWGLGAKRGAKGEGVGLTCGCQVRRSATASLV